MLRLRNEVAILRRQAGELERQQDQNRKLQAALAAPPQTAPAANPKDIFPKESWAFVGFADPESTIQSAAWAMSRGDFQSLLASLTPEQQANHQRQFAGKSEQEIATMMANNKDYKNMSGYQITNREILSDREMVLSLYQQGRDRTIQMVLKRIGDEWKLDGPQRSSPNR